ncbi:MAG TPA: hypothetical protein VFV19_19695 [Candidatus Polarisedimenticolaceae bacterium]|nr:hypothetical protein [Candidatus Polarisedimenticolaceae bacterium]
MPEASAIEIQDSTLKWVMSFGDGVAISVTAYIHHPSHPSARGGSSFWLEDFYFEFRKGQVRGGPPRGSLRIASGQLEVRGERYANLIPLPFRKRGYARLELLGSNRRKIVIEGKDVLIIPKKDVRLEEFTGAVEMVH